MDTETVLNPGNKERGSTTILAVGVVLLIFVALFAGLTTSEMATERVRQQTGADLGALAGANALSKATQTTRLIDFSVWARNTTLDALYLAATGIAIVSAGTGAEAFELPINFQKATDGPIFKLESARNVINETAVVYAVANGASVIRANDSHNFGLAVPLALGAAESPMSVKELDLRRRIKVSERRADISRNKMNKVGREYYAKKEELIRQGKSDKEVADDPEVAALKHKLHQFSGSIGGNSNYINVLRKKLGELDKGKGAAFAGRDGVIGLVYHQSSRLPFSHVFGGIETGDNVAIAAAAVVDGPPTATIGEEAIRNLLVGARVPPEAADGLNWMAESINVVGHDMRNLEKRYGPIGGIINKALGGLGLVPPPLTETRPALVSVDKTLSDSSKIYGLAKKAVSVVRLLEGKRGVKVLPDTLGF